MQKKKRMHYDIGPGRYSQPRSVGLHPAGLIRTSDVLTKYETKLGLQHLCNLGSHPSLKVPW